MRRLLAALLLLAPAAHAQTPSPPPASAGQGTDIRGGSATNGVIKPPTNIDPSIAKPAPRTGNMPIVPPPGQGNSKQPDKVPK